MKDALRGCSAPAAEVEHEKGRSKRFGLRAPLMFEILNLWEGFKDVVKFIDNNGDWLDALMGKDYLYKTKD